MKKEYNKILSQWKKLVKPEESAEKKNQNSKPKTPPKKEEDEFPAKYLIEGSSRRNNTRKNLYKNLTRINSESYKNRRSNL